MNNKILWAATCLFLTACNGSGSSSDSGTTTDSTTTSLPVFTSWIVNTSQQASNIFSSSASSERPLVNVQSVAVESASTQDYVRVQATGIPGYQITMSQSIINELNGRPKANSDFTTGSTTASVGQVVAFGEDIGYVGTQGCTSAGGGRGFWPPGPACPLNANISALFPSVPAATSTTCKVGLGAQGYWVNGVSVFTWGDGQSFNGQGTWNSLAGVAEQYDVDICGGHAQQDGEYHHHFHSQCLADLVGDTGSGHSPIYGFAADGYAIYGPYVAANVLAKSAWVARDYSNAATGFGCAVSGERSCLMVDEFDKSKGTTPTANAGPNTSASNLTLSGNSIPATSGYYYEDFYFDSDLTNTTGQTDRMDVHNGHSHDSLGYHYHVTVTAESDGSLTPAFPYHIGPTFAGALQENALTSCSP
ncbi:MAG TPA: hypothetical protein DIW43_02685 [Spongiibacteraceae bacterium]|nr:hypothetical protein [Spongiibacteraceae bacterium]HCS26330.1 hypothetical protein [Spongiibacteraceae bacterium]